MPSPHIKRFEKCQYWSLWQYRVSQLKTERYPTKRDKTCPHTKNVALGPSLEISSIFIVLIAFQETKIIKNKQRKEGFKYPPTLFRVVM